VERRLLRHARPELGPRRRCKGRPFYYFAYGAAVSEVLVDTLTGEHRLLRADLLHDVGASLNPAHRHRPGRRRLHPGHGLADHGGAGLAPADRRAADPRAQHLQDPHRQRLPGASAPRCSTRRTRADTIHRSKAVGEPPLLLAFSVFLAIRDAVSAVGGHRSTRRCARRPRPLNSRR
jgi:xanthine dehydrogenase large subunit